MSNDPSQSGHLSYGKRILYFSSFSGTSTYLMRCYLVKLLLKILNHQAQVQTEGCHFLKFANISEFKANL